MKEDIKSLTYPALCQRFGDLGLKRFRADQVYGWLHKVGVGPSEADFIPDEGKRKR